jgi:hypothetical protein
VPGMKSDALSFSAKAAVVVLLVILLILDFMMYPFFFILFHEPELRDFPFIGLL